jgi:hypothetical protein
LEVRKKPEMTGVRKRRNRRKKRNLSEEVWMRGGEKVQSATAVKVW